MIHYLILSEFSVPILLVLLLLRRRVCIIDRMPAFGGSALTRLEAWLTRKNLVEDVRVAVPSVERFWHTNSPYHIGAYFDNYLKAEPAIEASGRFDRIDAGVPDYAAAAKSVVGNVLDKHVFLVYMLPDLEKAGGEIIGLPRDIEENFAFYWKRPLTLRNRRIPTFNRLVNLIMGCGASMLLALRMLRMLRRRPPAAEDVFFAVDTFEAYPRTQRLVDDIVCGDVEPLYVARTKAVRDEVAEMLAGKHLCSRQDGVLDPSMAAGAAQIAFCDVARLWLGCGHLHPRVMREIYGLAAWRLTYRGFFRVFRTAFFLGRDDYSPEHHMRTQELHRIGGRSLGIRHGLDWAGYHGGFRYLDFDLYYVFGEENGRVRWHQERYPPHMNIRIAGSWGMSRAELAELPAPQDRPKDILVATSNAPGGVEAALAARVLAAAFPEKTIYFRPKWHVYPEMPALTKAIQDVLADPPANVVVGADKSYQIFGKVSYVVGNASSMIAEALQYGCSSFCLDEGFAAPESRPLIYHNYPFIMTASAEDAAKRIKSMENGDWTYPRKNAGDLIDLTGTVIFDLIRKDMGMIEAGAGRSEERAATTGISEQTRPAGRT